MSADLGGKISSQAPTSSVNSSTIDEVGTILTSIPHISGYEQNYGLGALQEVPLEEALKEELFDKVMPYFIWTNAAVLVGTVLLMIVETTLVLWESSYARITNDKVLMCLLAATTVQMGAIALRISKSLFK